MPGLCHAAIKVAQHHAWSIQCWNYRCVSKCMLCTVMRLLLCTTMPGLHSLGIIVVYLHAWSIQCWDYRYAPPCVVYTLAWIPNVFLHACSLSCWIYRCTPLSLSILCCGFRIAPQCMLYRVVGLQTCTTNPGLHGVVIIDDQHHAYTV